MARVSKERADRIQGRSGHNVNDPMCKRWQGDFAGVDLNGVCQICRSVLAGEPEPARKELGKLGKWVVSVVMLALISPFVATLWAWASDVIRGFGD